MLMFLYAAGLGMVALALGYWLVHTLRIMLVSMAAMPICPECGTTTISVSKTARRLDWCFRVFGCLPYRCRICSFRFYRPRVAIMTQQCRLP